MENKIFENDEVKKMIFSVKYYNNIKYQISINNFILNSRIQFKYEVHASYSEKRTEKQFFIL